MIKRSFGFGIAALAATGVLMTHALGVAANDGPIPPISDVVAFSGQATLTDTDGDNALDLIGDGGSFSFNSTVCLGASNPDVPTDLTVEAGLCVLNETGTFANTVCGTGTADGSGSISGPDNGTVVFHITFVATIGVIQGSITDGGDTEPLVGVVSLGPPLAPYLPNLEGGIPPSNANCTNGFTATGVVVALEI